MKETVIGGSILGSDKFIGWVRERFLPSKSREIPTVKQLNSAILGECAKNRRD